MARHQVFIIAAPLPDNDGVQKELRQHLDRLPTDFFGAFGMLHFASFVILTREMLGDEPPLLVLECNIDGSVAPFLRALAGSREINDIFSFCGGYPAAGKDDAKFRYLKSKMRWPQLFHVGAPWRSVSSIKDDHAVRRTLESGLDQTTSDSLMTDIVVPPAGQHEYWLWEILKPWTAWLVGAGGVVLALSLVAMTATSLPPWAVLALTALYVAIALKSILAGLALWYESLPELRARVLPRIRWILLTGAWVGAAWWLAPAHPRWAFAVLVAWALTFIFSVFAEIRRRSNERLAAIRVNADGRTIADIWEALKNNPVQYQSETDWAQRFLYWTAWPIAIVLVGLPIFLLRDHLWALIACVGTLFFFKAVWLAVLAGWPSKNGAGDAARIVLFIVFATVIAAGATGLLMVIHWPEWFGSMAKASLLTVLALIGLFLLWAMPLPSPDAPRPQRRPELDEVISQEDLGVQNHMSAVVVLKQDHAYRVPALKAFLFVLNRLFYRCWAPDLYRGKLFGIPTVHFAQWVLLDKRNYLFFSNYDNSWTTYLDDFGETLAAGLQKVWGQGEHNPGIKDLGRFKEFARSTMVPYSHWYSAYPEVTIRQVWNNREIRRGLAHATGEETMVGTLKRAGAAPRAIPDFYHGRVR